MHRSLLVAALVLTGFSMRTAVTSVGAVLDELQRGLGASGGAAGLITTLPVLCFAGVGALVPALTDRVGTHRLLVSGLLLTVAGLALRPVVSGTVAFALLSVVGLVGAAASNVLMPSLVKRHFPDCIGAMTALYTTSLAVGATAAAGLTVPIGDATDGWRGGLGAWAVPAALAVLPWLAVVRSPAGDAPDDHARSVPLRALVRSRTAWALTAFFAAQSMQAYIAFGWFARFLGDHGVAASTAGAMVALLSAVGIPISLVVPRVRRQFGAIVVLIGANLVAYTGLALAPAGGAWVWMVLAGIGGGTFPLVLTLIGQRARTAEGTATLSAFVQSIGYVVAGAGPFLFGALFGATGSWGLPLAVLFAAAGVNLATGRACSRHRFVEDEVSLSGT